MPQKYLKSRGASTLYAKMKLYILAICALQANGAMVGLLRGKMLPAQPSRHVVSTSTLSGSVSSSVETSSQSMTTSDEDDEDSGSWETDSDETEDTDISSSSRTFSTFSEEADVSTESSERSSSMDFLEVEKQSYSTWDSDGSDVYFSESNDMSSSERERRLEAIQNALLSGQDSDS